MSNKPKVFRLPRTKKVTPAEILRQDAVNGLLEDTIKNRTKIDGILIITTGKDDIIHWNRAGLNDLEVIGLLEQVKAYELAADDDDPT